MKSFVRYSVLIGVTALITAAIAVALFGSPTAVAQPMPAGSAQPAPVEAGSAAAPAPAAGSATPAAAGSAAPAAGAGSAAAPAPAVPWYEALEQVPVEEEGTFWIPKSVNLEADSTDQMFYAVLGLSAFFFTAITICVVYFVVKYRHRPGHKAQPSAAHNDALEITWTVIPTIITVFLFYYGWRTYVKVVTPPNQAIEINVVASKWNWEFTHQNGAKDSNLHVPVNQPIRLVMTSNDVLHSFYAPVMRVKQDIIPRRYTYAWFLPTKPGTYRLTCAEYCGTNHSQMACKKFDEKTGAFLQRAVVVVHASLDEYKKYLDEINVGNLPPEQLGMKLYTRAGCVNCHTIDGSPRIGPSFKGNWGTPRKLSDGSEIVMDEAYVRESLETPNAKVRAGFNPVMTSFAGKFKESEIQAIIAFLKSLK